MIIIWCKFGTTADAQKFPAWTVNVLTLFLVMHTSPSFVALHHRLQQSASEWIFLAFKNHITDCILQVLAFFIFVFIFKDYSKWGKKLWHCTAQYMCSLWHTEGWLIFTGRFMSPAWLLFVIISYFLDAPCTCGELGYQKHGMSPLPVNLLQNMSLGKSRRIRWVQSLIIACFAVGMLRASWKLLNDADGIVLLSGWTIEISTATWDNKYADCTHYIKISPHFNTWWEFCQESQ